MNIGFSGRVNKGSGAAPDCQGPGRAPFVRRKAAAPAAGPYGLFRMSQFGMSRLLRLDSRTFLNVLMACSSSTSDQAEKASFTCSIEHVHSFTVILPHRMQGMIPPIR